jgi:hypothetical protein
MDVYPISRLITHFLCLKAWERLSTSSVAIALLGHGFYRKTPVSTVLAFQRAHHISFLFSIQVWSFVTTLIFHKFFVERLTVDAQIGLLLN